MRFAKSYSFFEGAAVDRQANAGENAVSLRANNRMVRFG